MSMTNGGTTRGNGRVVVVWKPCCVLVGGVCAQKIWWSQARVVVAWPCRVLSVARGDSDFDATDKGGPSRS